MNIGRYVVETLAANGIDTAFGIPGVHNIELYRGLESGRMRHVLVRHEQNAVFAADGYARASGRPAAAFVISGPGFTNSLTAMGQAWSDSVPLLTVASTPARPTLGKRWGVLHELLDQHAVASQFAGIARAAHTAQDVADHLRAVLGALRAGRPRPAYLEIPLDLLAESTDMRPQLHARPAGASHPAPAELRQAAAQLAAAQRPLVIAGGGARHCGAALAQLVERLDAYLVTTVAAKGVLPESHPANLGAALPWPPAQRLVREADVVLALGTELSETDIYTGTRLEIPGRLIRVDVDPCKLADHYGAQLTLWSDTATALAGLLELLPAARSGWRSRSGPARDHRAAIQSGWDARVRLMAEVLAALRAALPADAIVFSDMTQIAYLGNYAWPTDVPGSWFHPSGYGTLGFALPAAIGAKLALPQRAVAALAGDFGVQFTLQELMTAVELALPLPLVIWNNEALGQIRDDMIAAGIATIGVKGRNPDFPALARACGAAAERVTDTASLGAAVRTALAARGPTVIEFVAA